MQYFSGETRIGSDSLNDSRTFTGKISEAAVFNYSLSLAQVKGIYINATAGTPPVPPSVTLSVVKSGAGVQLQWTQGTLLEATTVKGPWTTNASAVSPFTVNPTGAQRFYRVLVQ